MKDKAADASRGLDIWTTWLQTKTWVRRKLEDVVIGKCIKASANRDRLQVIDLLLTDLFMPIGLNNCNIQSLALVRS
jgi:hypothetical protein